MKYPIIFTLIILLSLSFVSAVPSPQTNVNLEVGLEIQYPAIDILKQGNGFDFKFHVFNKSTGLSLSNDTTICKFHLYNSTGYEFVDEELSMNINLVDFEITVLGGNFTNTGFYSYITQCNTSDFGGFISVPIIVTPTGFELTESKAIIYIGLFGILIFLFVVNLISISLLPSKDNYDEEGTLISINQLKYVRPVLYAVSWFLLISLVFITSNIALAYLETTLIGDLLFKLFQVMMALSLPMVVLWFIYIFYNIFQDEKMKGYIERGIESTK